MDWGCLVIKTFFFSSQAVEKYTSEDTKIFPRLGPSIAMVEGHIQHVASDLWHTFYGRGRTGGGGVCIFVDRFTGNPRFHLDEFSALPSFESELDIILQETKTIASLGTKRLTKLTKEITNMNEHLMIHTILLQNIKK
ncbi:hypothetical protein ACJX0J_032603 [Zea mays]